MAHTQYFPRQKIVVGSVWHHVRCDECKYEANRFENVEQVWQWWGEHQKNFDHHLYYWQTAEVING
jgi:hypothetical protein